MRRRVCTEFMVAAAVLALAASLAAGCRPAARTGDGARGVAGSFDATPAVALEPAFSGVAQPVHLTHAGDGSGRMFVVELAGVIRVIEGGRLLDKPFLDISPMVSTGIERGFFSVAFAPDYETSGRFYVDYTDTAGDSVVARYRVSSTDRNVADRDSAQIILTVDQPFPNHNGGQLAFGPDGMLYIGFGDGGAAGDPFGNGQKTDTLLGKVLRIDVSGPAGYSVPADNPFAGRDGFRPEIWALGLRNPWRFSFDSETGELYIADVGQSSWEEIDVVPADSGGANFGWDLYEGAHPYSRETSEPAAGRLTMPVAEYGRDQGISVTGGYVYRGDRSPTLDGVYFYGDYGSGRLFALAREDGEWKTGAVAETGSSIAGFGQDESGEVYVLDFDGGTARRIVAR